MERQGYVYILATAYKTAGGQQIIKIGRTSRSPKARVRELSRGSPAGMTLVGAVPCRDMVELEKRAHRQFGGARFESGGGTEYFTANADDVLNWLRAETPRFDLESARKDAWAEYIETRPFKVHNRIILLFMMPLVLSPGFGFLIIRPIQLWTILLGPAVMFALMRLVAPSVRRLSYMKRLDADLQSVQRELEAKYHLPHGGVRHG